MEGRWGMFDIRSFALKQNIQIELPCLVASNLFCSLRQRFRIGQPPRFRSILEMAETWSVDSVCPKNLLETHIFEFYYCKK